MTNDGAGAPDPTSSEATRTAFPAPDVSRKCLDPPGESGSGSILQKQDYVARAPFC
jgi:hypothetical protein